MNKIKIYVVTVFILFQHLQLLLCSIPELEENLFHNTNNKLQNVMNKLFKTFELNKNFSEANNVLLILKMHDDFKNKSENNFKTYKNIAKQFNVGDNKNFTALFNLTEVIEEIFKDEHFNLFNNSLLNTKLNELVATNYTSEYNDTSVFTSKIFKKAMSKMNNISLESMKYSDNKYESNMGGWRRSGRKKTFNIQFWCK